MLLDYLKYNDPLHIIWRKGTVDDPYVDKVDTRKIVNGLLVLDEIPDEFSRVSIEGFKEIRKGVPQETEFIVSYQTGIVVFHPSAEGQTVTATYKGRGIIQYPAERIYLHNENPDLVTNVQELIDKGHEGIVALGQVDGKLAEADSKIAQTEVARQDAITATQNVNTAISNANNAIANAETATQSANTATLEAKTATQNAITATNNAKTAAQGAVVAKENAELAATEALQAKADTELATTRANTATAEAQIATTQAQEATSGLQTVVDNAVSATTNANASISEMNTKITEADTAILNANEAIGKANTASLNADNKAVYATEQGDYAKTQGDYALTQANQAIEQGNYAKTQGDYAKNQGATVEGAVSAMVHLGEYDPSASYVKNNSVRYEGSTYTCKVDCSGVLPTNNIYWELTAQRGLDGQGSVESVNSKVGHVVINKDDIGLSNVADVLQASKVEFDAHVNDNTSHVTEIERQNWNSKADANHSHDGVDFHSLPLSVEADDADELIIYDVSEVGYRKQTREDFLSGVGEDMFFRVKSEEFVASAGQQVFTLTTGSYEIGQGRLAVFVDGVRQPSSAFTETSPTEFSLVEPLPAGVTDVYAEWFEVTSLQSLNIATSVSDGLMSIADKMQLDNLQGEIDAHANESAPHSGHATVASLDAHKADYAKQQFEAWIYKAGYRYVTKFDEPTAGIITEQIIDIVTGEIVGSRTTEFDVPEAGAITETLQVTEPAIHVRKITRFDTPEPGMVSEEVMEVTV